MALTITKAQRAALYDQILDRLSGIGDIEVAIEAGNYTAAKRLTSEYSDDLRLLVDDLGFGEKDDEPVELTAPPEVLCRVLPRMRDLAERYTAGLEQERGEVRKVQDRNRLVAEACQRVLSDLDATETDSRWTISRLPSLLPRFPRVSATRGQAEDAQQVVNLLLLSAILVAEPVAGKDHDGNAVTQLLIVIADPDAEEGSGRVMHEVEVPDDVAERYGKKLRAGNSVFVAGQLNSNGGITATEINPGPPPGEGPTDRD